MKNVTRRSGGPVPVGAALLSAVCLVPTPQDEGLTISETHDVVEQWVETRRVISKETIENIGRHGTSATRTVSVGGRRG